MEMSTLKPTALDLPPLLEEEDDGEGKSIHYSSGRRNGRENPVLDTEDDDDETSSKLVFGTSTKDASAHINSTSGRRSANNAGTGTVRAGLQSFEFSNTLFEDDIDQVREMGGGGG
jgi:hypothetical protein